jgi:hypothetical protein
MRAPHLSQDTVTCHGTSLLFASPWAPWALAYVLRWTARCHGWSSAERITRAGRAARVSDEARRAEERRKDMAELWEDQLTRAKSN